MKYAIADFEPRTGFVFDDQVIWKEGTLENAKEVVHKNPNKCVLFYHRDVEGLGCPQYKNATREQFEALPAIKGVAYYKGWSGYVFE